MSKPAVEVVPNAGVQNPRKRYTLYIAAALVIVAMTLATLITLDLFTLQDVQDWISLVLVLLTALVGFAGSLLAASNVPKRDQSGSVVTGPENGSGGGGVVDGYPSGLPPTLP